MSSSFKASPWLQGLERSRVAAMARMEQSGAETPEEYAAWCGVELRDTHLDGAHGQLIEGPLGTYIVLADHLSDRGRRWTIGHELGHYDMRHPAPTTAELCGPRPTRLYRRCWDRDREDEANEWGMVFTMPDKVVARFCDRLPLTLDAAEQLAQTAGVPLVAAAIRLTEVTFRVCAAVLSLHGVIQWVSPSVRFLMLASPASLSPDTVVRPGSLARRFYDTGKLRDQPELVPAAAWFDGMGKGSCVQEHTIHLDEPGRVLTLLSTPSDVDAERDPLMTPHATAFLRDYLLSSDLALADFNERFLPEEPCPYAPTWLEAFMRSAG
jgi:hypothetical protein